MIAIAFEKEKSQFKRKKEVPVVPLRKRQRGDFQSAVARNQAFSCATGENQVRKERCKCFREKVSRGEKKTAKQANDILPPRYRGKVLRSAMGGHQSRRRPSASGSGKEESAGEG